MISICDFKGVIVNEVSEDLTGVRKKYYLSGPAFMFSYTFSVLFVVV